MSDEPPVRLYCFAHSGNGVSVFDGWAAHTGPGVEPVPVRLPAATAWPTGPAPATRQALLNATLPQVTPTGAAPYAMYGHGLGAVIALTVAQALTEARLPGPCLLAVGACAPPTPPGGHISDHDLLHQLGGHIPPASDEGVFLRAMLPVLRADLELARSLHEAARRPLSTGPLTTPLLVVASQSNPLAPPAAADGWHAWTKGPRWQRTVPGHHFFVRGGRQLPRLLGRACRVARRLAQEPAPAG
ncbi:thioesterase II family protein [Streptomyces sp. B93]|uniref:thioesterase II family protein n=1 Tax=Streptomyces sp. B93 TaxID=2824875 RepID=UPI001B360FA3|nr:thioesterase domain-containing protein [Streptomyces sp. B93]MBQ1094458.1 thioesterase [Streptomyces sp. B93]